MSRRQLLLYLAWGGLLYALALLAMLPAAWLSQTLEQLSGQRLELRETSGSAWEGSGRLYARTGAGALTDLGAVRWTSFPSAVLRGKLGADMTLNDAPKPIRVEVGPGSIAVRDLSLAVPGKLVAALAPPLQVFGPEGRITIQSDSLRIEGETVLGLATVEWRDIRLARSSGLELGSHVARLRGAGSRVDIELGTLGGPLGVAGAGTWSARDGLALSGTADPRPDAPPGLVPFLRGVCPEFRDGRCVFRIKYLQEALGH
jgi:general secretion pathway protein N